MNGIKAIRDLNLRELENGIGPNASWHVDHRDSAYIYIGGLPFELSEGDIITIFSQYGEPTYINLVRDKETGKSKGFAFLKYEDQRSTDLAVDNLGGATVMGRMLRVDHTKYKKRDDGEPDPGIDLEEQWRKEQGENGEEESEEEVKRPVLKEERELAKLIQEHDEDDPMKAFLVQEKKEEVEAALKRLEGGKGVEKEKRHKHRHHHRSRRPKEEGDERESRHSHRKEGEERKRSRSRDRRDRRNEERSHKSRPSEPEGKEVYKPRSRSPRREDRVSDERPRRDDFARDDRYRRDDRSRDEQSSRRRRERSPDERDRRSRRYS
jgi:RNA-binding motif X-linked protein 2